MPSISERACHPQKASETSNWSVSDYQPDDLGIFRSSEDALALTEDRIGDRGRLVETIDDPAPGIMEARESFGPVLIPGDRIATPALSL
jgi:hypothetical protein